MQLIMCNFLLVTTLATYINRTPIKNNMSHLLVRIRLTLPLERVVGNMLYWLTGKIRVNERKNIARSIMVKRKNKGEREEEYC